MGAIIQRQIKTIYAIGNTLGIVGRGTHDDDLHALVATVAGKGSVRALTYQEASQVITELKRIQGGTQCPPSKVKHEERPGGVTAAQQKKAWALMYDLQTLSPSPARLGERLCGIVRKDLHMDATPERPFAWLTFRAGNTLIEILKKYVANAKRKEGEHSG